MKKQTSSDIVEIEFERNIHKTNERKVEKRT